jgi:hypothetical protein
MSLACISISYSISIQWCRIWCDSIGTGLGGGSVWKCRRSHITRHDCPIVKLHWYKLNGSCKTRQPLLTIKIGICGSSNSKSRGCWGSDNEPCCLLPCRSGPFFPRETWTIRLAYICSIVGMAMAIARCLEMEKHVYSKECHYYYVEKEEWWHLHKTLTCEHRPFTLKTTSSSLSSPPQSLVRHSTNCHCCLLPHHLPFQVQNRDKGLVPNFFQPIMFCANDINNNSHFGSRGT